MAYIYILKDKISGRHYIGSCVNLNDRIKRNKAHTASFITSKGEYELLCYDVFQDLQEARKMERLLKSYKGRNSFKNIISEWSKAHTPLSGASC